MRKQMPDTVKHSFSAVTPEISCVNKDASAWKAQILRIALNLGLVVLLILNSNVRVRAQRIEETRFGDALEKLDIEAVRQALRTGANPNERFGGKGRSAIARVTIALIVSREYRDEGKLRRELEERIIAVLEELFKAGATIRSHDDDILDSSAIAGASLVAKYLLDRGANPNGRGGGSTPVVIATKYGHPDIVNLLVEYGARPLHPVTTAQIRFVAAAGKGDLIAMTEELKKGAQVNTRSPTGEIALVAAIEEGHFRGGNFKAVTELLRLGANPNLPADSPIRVTALHAAVFINERSFDADNGPAIVQALIKAGAHVSSTAAFQEQTPLHIAARLQNARAVRILLEAGAKVMPRDAKGKTPLDYAEAAPVIEVLKSHGAKELP